MSLNGDLLRSHKAALESYLEVFMEVAANDAIQHYRENFDKEGYVDDLLAPWQKRKFNPFDDGHKILNKSGALKASIRVISKTRDSITLGSDLPYAKIHNEGGSAMAYGKYAFEMPKRQFMGDSSILERNLLLKLDSGIQQIFI